MAESPLDRVVDFFKPMIDSHETESLGTYRRPGEPLAQGINVWRSDSQPGFWHVDEAGSTFTIFGSVHPVTEVPEGASVIADLHDATGGVDSHVLWYPERKAVVVPFDPNEAIDAYRREWYASPSKQTALPAPLLGLYYLVGKRLLPRPVKRALRRSIASKALASHVATKWPLDESADALQRFMLRLILLASGRERVDFGWFWPQGRRWAVALTHDVETGAGLAKTGLVTALEVERGMRSSFNLVPLDYEAPEETLDSLRRRGLEIGVHGYTHDGLLFSNWATFEKRRGTINDYAKRWGASGFRSPATYRNADWFRWLEFEYDSSFSNSAPCEPQPGGCATLFPYHIEDMVELPITLPQDHTIFELLGHDDARMWIDCLDRIRNSCGMACVLTHPDPTPSYIGGPGNMKHYATLLDYVKEWDAWTPLPRDLARWWTARAAATPQEAAAMAGGVGSASLGPDGRLRITAPARRPAHGAPIPEPRLRSPSAASPPAPSTRSA